MPRWLSRSIRLLALVVAFTSDARLHGQASQASDKKPKFEVASIKACGAADPGFRGGGPTEFSPNRVAINCQILIGLIQQAYIAHANGQNDQSAVLRIPIEGGPDWMSSERYSITAKAGGEVPAAMMLGPMLQTLLEDRFKLQVRRLARDVPTWNLVVVKGGPKLTPFTEGECVLNVLTLPPAPAAPLAPGQRRCREVLKFTGTSMVADVEGQTLDEVGRGPVFIAAGRPITNKTGMAGRFNFHLEYAPPDGMRLNGQDALPEPTAPSIFTAVQEQLGLKLESAKGTGEYLVIDHVERPTPD